MFRSNLPADGNVSHQNNKTENLEFLETQEDTYRINVGLETKVDHNQTSKRYKK